MKNNTRELTDKNPLAQILIIDPLPPDCLASYECQIDLPRVVINDQFQPEERVFGDHCIVPTHYFPDVETFNKALIAALYKAAEITNRIVPTIMKAFGEFEPWDVMCARVIVSHQNTSTDQSMKVEKHCGRRYGNGLEIMSSDYLTGDDMIFIADPEFLGVIPETRDGKLGIGIINPRGVCIVRPQKFDECVCPQCGNIHEVMKI